MKNFPDQIFEEYLKTITSDLTRGMVKKTLLKQFNNNGNQYFHLKDYIFEKFQDKETRYCSESKRFFTGKDTFLDLNQVTRSGVLYFKFLRQE